MTGLKYWCHLLSWTSQCSLSTLAVEYNKYRNFYMKYEINCLFATKHSDGMIDNSQLQPSCHLFGNLPGRRNLAPHLAVGPLPLLFPVVLQRRGEDVVPRNRPDDRPQDDVVPRARSRPSKPPSVSVREEDSRKGQSDVSYVTYKRQAIPRKASSNI